MTTLPLHLSQKHFSARLVANASLPQQDSSKTPIEVYTLEPDARDIAYLQNQLEVFKENEAIPKIPGVKPSFLKAHIQECLEEAITALTQTREGKVIVAPIVQVAVQPKSHELLGLNLSGKERHLENGNNIYTPVPIDIEGDQVSKDEANEGPNHWSDNFLTKTTPLKRVGDALLIAMRNALPTTVKRIDLVSENKDKPNCTIAEGFYKRFGFIPIRGLMDSFITSTKKTFNQVFDGDAVPMTTQADYFSSRCDKHAKEIEFEARAGQPFTDLTIRSN